MSRYAFALFLLVAVRSALAQSAIAIDESTARQSLIKQTEPVYPPIARAAHVAGDVAIQLQIDTSGHVISTKVLSGPPMLRQASIDAVKTWEFKPFEQAGQPVEVSATIVIPFSLGPVDLNDQQIARVYFPLFNACIKLVGQRADPAEQSRACKEAAAEADKFGSNARFIERRSSYVYCTTALIRNKEIKEALIFADKAVAVVQQGHDDGSGSSAAYSVRAQAEAAGGRLADADRDLVTAERFEKEALNSPAGKSLKKQYTATLKSLLNFHAQVLSALGNSTDASSKLSEANAL